MNNSIWVQGTIDDTYQYLDKDSFLLVIMTAFQAQMFEMFSRKVVCIDSMHKTNPYGFKLVTIVVPDEFKNVILHITHEVQSVIHILLIYRNSSCLGHC